MNITRKSMLTGKERTRDLPITDEQVAAYSAGKLVQDAFPDLSEDDREFFVSGITDDEWNEAFGGDDEIDLYPEEDEPAF